MLPNNEYVIGLFEPIGESVDRKFNFSWLLEAEFGCVESLLYQ
jgi:hypothetical protein